MSGYNRQGQPYNPMSVPDRVFGNQKVSRQRTGETVSLPGNQEAELIREVTETVCPPPDICNDDCFETVQRAPHLDVSWEGDFVFITETVTVPGATTGPNLPGTLDASVFQVLEGWTFFVEKLLIQPLDSAWESLQIIPLMDGAPVLAPFSNSYNLLPLLPQGQRNTRWEIDSGHTFGIRLTNYQQCSRMATVGYVGWIERLKCNERRIRS
jgi:hypothetical protein